MIKKTDEVWIRSVALGNHTMRLPHLTKVSMYDRGGNKELLPFCYPKGDSNLIPTNADWLRSLPEDQFIKAVFKMVRAGSPKRVRKWLKMQRKGGN